MVVILTHFNGSDGWDSGQKGKKKTVHKQNTYILSKDENYKIKQNPVFLTVLQITMYPCLWDS